MDFELTELGYLLCFENKKAKNRLKDNDYNLIKRKK